MAALASLLIENHSHMRRSYISNCYISDCYISDCYISRRYISRRSYIVSAPKPIFNQHKSYHAPILAGSHEFVKRKNAH
jgi:hypothetical protein